MFQEQKQHINHVYLFPFEPSALFSGCQQLFFNEGKLQLSESNRKPFSGFTSGKLGLNTGSDSESPTREVSRLSSSAGLNENHELWDEDTCAGEKKIYFHSSCEA